MNRPAIWSLAIFMLSATLITSCDKDDDDDGEKTVYTANNLPINAAQEVPAPVTATTATGTMNVSYDKTSKKLVISATWSGLTADPVAAHIHGTAAKGKGAGVKVDFHDNVTSASGNFNRTIDVDEIAIKEDSLLAGFYYFNIHTPANPPGEIRGQIEFTN